MATSAETSVVGYQPGVSLADLQFIIEQTPEPVWDALREQRIFITGGTGFVGCWLVEALLWANEQLGLGLSIALLTRQPEAFIAKAPHLAKHKVVKLIKGNVNNLDAVDQQFDIVIHAATDVVKSDANPLVVFEDIVNGTKQTLELARRIKAQRYLLTSSGAVYGRQPAALTHIPETYAGAPDTLDLGSAYGQGKRVSEWWSQHYIKQHGLDVKIARCFALVGPYLPLNAHFAIGNFIRDGLDGKNIAVSGDGSACRSYLYAADMTVWLLSILINGQAGQAYNLGSADEISIKELAEKVSHIIHGENKVSVAAAPVENTSRQRYVPDIKKMEIEMGLIPHTDLGSAIEKTIQWEIRNRELSKKENCGSLHD